MDFTLLFFILVPVVIAYIWYVSLVGKKNGVLESLSGIDVQLKKRSNLIPNILKIAKKFLEHEKEVMQEITKLRTQVDSQYDRANPMEVQEHLKTAELLASKMGGFMVQVEDYPDLKSDQTMLNAMQSYNEVEAQIAAARRFYNSAVKSLNTSVEIFPGSIIANIAAIRSMPYYEADEAAKTPVNASDYL